MGIHSPFGYVGYETNFAETIVFLARKFCGGCHTNDDFKEGCKGCPVGQMIYAAKEYIKEMYIPSAKADFFMTPAEFLERRKGNIKRIKAKSKLLRKMRKEAEKINPKPHMLSSWIWQIERTEDPLLPLEKLAKDIEFIETGQVNPFIIEEDVKKRLNYLIEKEKEMSK